MPVRVWPRAPAHNMKDNFYLISDTNKKSLKIKSLIEKKIIHTSIKKSKAVIVIGGMDFMLNALKSFINLTNLFTA